MGTKGRSIVMSCDPDKLFKAYMCAIINMFVNKKGSLIKFQCVMECALSTNVYTMNENCHVFCMG